MKLQVKMCLLLTNILLTPRVLFTPWMMFATRMMFAPFALLTPLILFAPGVMFALKDGGHAKHCSPTACILKGGKDVWQVNRGNEIYM